jgi:galactokinase
MSSSAAVEVAFLAAWNRLGDLNLDGITMAKVGQRTENDYIGLASGIMDQFASVHGADARLVLLDCRTLEHEWVPLPGSCAILVADSGVRRALASSEYNVRRSQCEEAVSILNGYLPGIRTLRDVSPQVFEGLAQHLPVVLRRRAQHVIEECQRVLQGASFLKAGDVKAFGGLIRRSHASARDLYEVSIPELDLLAETAWKVRGCYGARLTGAGFGGCVVILAEKNATERIKDSLQNAYASTYERSLHVFETNASQGVQVMEV